MIDIHAYKIYFKKYSYYKNILKIKNILEAICMIELKLSFDINQLLSFSFFFFIDFLNSLLMIVNFFINIQ